MNTVKDFEGNSILDTYNTSFRLTFQMCLREFYITLYTRVRILCKYGC